MVECRAKQSFTHTHSHGERERQTKRERQREGGHLKLLRCFHLIQWHFKRCSSDMKNKHVNTQSRSVFGNLRPSDRPLFSYSLEPRDLSHDDGIQKISFESSRSSGEDVREGSSD